jgi:hypothetical protein
MANEPTERDELGNKDMDWGALPATLPPPPPPPAPEAEEEVTEEEDEAEAEERCTAEEWAKRLGHIQQANPHVPQSITHYDWRHACADVLCGWSRHAYHYQNDPLLLTQEDYETALENAAEYPNKPAHEPAMSPLVKPKETV